MTDRTRIVAATAVLLTLSLAAGCGAGHDNAGNAGVMQGGRKVAVIGWDAATWTVIDPMLARGELPNLRRLLDRGSRGVLRADPPILSPVVWTTIATGFPPSEHGILNFQMPDPNGGPPVLAATFHRRRAPLWRMVSADKHTVGIVGWWTTWPAEPVRGYMVSDHLAYNRWTSWLPQADAKASYLTFPPSLTEALRPYAVLPADVGPDTILPIVPFNRTEVSEMMAADRPVIFHGPSVVRYGYSTDASNAAFAKHLLETVPQPDLFATVFILTDVAGHVFWHQYEPDSVPGAGGDTHLARAIPNIYHQVDAWTGELLDRLDPDTTVIVVSDHGMGPGSGPPHPGVNPAGDHEPEGIIVVAGPGLPVGADLGVHSQLDFAPTVLRLMGLPVAQDMPGRAIEPLVPGDARTLASYGDGRSDVPSDLPSPGAEDYEARLRSLGYIQ